MQLINFSGLVAQLQGKYGPLAHLLLQKCATSAAVCIFIVHACPHFNFSGGSMPKIDEKIEGMYQEVLKRNPGETEFHQAVLEVLECLGPL
jgi:hypothetical protein